MGDGPPGLITDEIREFSTPEEFYDYESATDHEEIKEKDDSLWREGVIHHLAKDSYVWNFSLLYKSGNFDVIKWKTGFSWKLGAKESDELLMNKAFFVGTQAGVFFILIDEHIDDNFTQLADMMDIFIQKTKAEAPFLVYGVIENKEKIAQLKTDKDLLKNLGEVKKWVTQHNGEFRLENLKEMRMNLSLLISDYSHFILTKMKSVTDYSTLKQGEVHYLDYQDVMTLKGIESDLAGETKAGESVDDLLSTMLIDFLKKPEFKEEAYVPPLEEGAVVQEETEEEIVKTPPSKIKLILEEIRAGIRRQCPKCFNNERKKIREVLDKENIIMQNPTIYGFKYVCGMCGKEWRTQKGWKIEEN